jgi:ribonuclease D
MKPIAEDCYYIANNDELTQAANIWRSANMLGIDSEFIRVDTFYPIPALLQMSDGKQCWLIDVLTISNFSPLVEILTAPHIVKVIHAASEDLEVFDKLFSILPTPLFDTQIAAALCGHGASMGYSRLVQTLFNIELSKDQCRSDWLVRPLTEEQQHYACLDVLYLPQIYQDLQQTLEHLQRTPWMEEESARQLERGREQRHSNYSLEKINNAWRLDNVERQRLWHLVLGRDALARQYNKARNHIAKDFALLEMARRPPTHLAALYSIEGLHPSAVRQFGTPLLQLAQKVPHDLVCPTLNMPLSKAENDYVKKLRATTEQIANRLQLPPELLVRKLELEYIVRQYLDKPCASDIAMPERFTGWRNTVISAALRDEIASWS